MNESYEYMLNLIGYIMGHGLTAEQCARVLIELEEKCGSAEIIFLA